MMRQFILILFLFLTTLLFGGQWVWQQTKQDLIDKQKVQLEKLSHYISSELDKFSHIPELISKDKALINALLSPDNSAQIEITNRYLTHVNQVVSATDTYLLNAYGTTIAASNWSLQRSFIGKNFAFRPYFKQAIQGDNSEYFALGVSSGVRGYYYGFPVVYAAEIIGVIVIKIELTAIESTWQQSQGIFIATDDNNIIFMSNRPALLFKSLTSLSDETLGKIKHSRQYLNADIQPLNTIGDLNLKSTTLTLKDSHISGEFITLVEQFPRAKLNLRSLLPTTHIYWALVNYLVIISLVFGVILLLLLLIRHQHLKHQQIDKIQAQAKQKLEFQVLERTAELHVEIRQRSEAETQLRQTQDELIQAAKLALLGQLSTSISHELNNPLAAIRSYAENGLRYLVKGKSQQASENFQRISALTQRMANISQQLRSFAKKSGRNDLSYTHLEPILLSTQALLKPQFNALSLTLNLPLDRSETPHDMPLSKIQIWANPIQLEQVLVNLLTNAMQEIRTLDNPQLCISLDNNASGTLFIHIDDNGCGVSKDLHNQLFEPFFTTKDNGLGLGLSISKQIIESFDGQLTYETSPMDGARFTISLLTKKNNTMAKEQT
ncbi:ATPase [Vibrio sp. UCD-FRSSP16_10]|uniref:sensor histidine kinase n=1 Tax=unclassified Vibrio TaxID=2614977 RepID=UPI0007FF8B6E|nr:MULTISPECIES: ATP-binding protein [unclassified Vibrio]OBT13698.1 ATPase [Vibrio sp. UCD-FRSSP16_30]OBT20023.1 ATPase [Vibrio sp. UCD-FRSSP16_10]